MHAGVVYAPELTLQKRCVSLGMYRKQRTVPKRSEDRGRQMYVFTYQQGTVRGREDGVDGWIDDGWMGWSVGGRGRHWMVGRWVGTTSVAETRSGGHGGIADGYGVGVGLPCDWVYL